MRMVQGIREISPHTEQSLLNPSGWRTSQTKILIPSRNSATTLAQKNETLKDTSIQDENVIH